jgi:2-oxoisovalerate dehydrogenase E2 component (dihydrolipoyl transacylase)
LGSRSGRFSVVGIRIIARATGTLPAMAKEFLLPDIGEGLTEAEIVRWLVAVGDVVTIDQLIVEVETAKTVVEIPSPFAGTMASLGAPAGTTVEVGTVLFTVAAEGDALSEPSAAVATDPLPQSTKPTSQARATTASPAVSASPKAKAMPIVRKLAEERGIDISKISGTGPGGTITRADVEAAEAPPSIAGVLVPLTQTRRAIADHMARSWAEIPHVTVQADIRAEELIAARGAGDTRFSIEAVVASKVLPLLKDFPDFNAQFSANGVLQRTEYHLGFAVDTEAGLMVVVLKNADQLTNEELDSEFSRLAAAAQNRTATLDELTGQTFTISNIGALGGGHGTPIIPIGTTAILSIGRALTTPVVTDGKLGIGMVAPIDLSYDHRVIDGGLGQRFLGSVVTALET